MKSLTKRAKPLLHKKEKIKDKCKKGSVRSDAPLVETKVNSSQLKTLRNIIKDLLRSFELDEDNVRSVVELVMSKMDTKTENWLIFSEDGANCLERASDNIKFLLTEQRRNVAAITAQSVFKTWYCRKQYLAIPPITRRALPKYQEAFRNLLRVETEYATRLSAIIKYYKIPMTSRFILDPEESSKLFSNIEALWTQHQLFTDGLQKLIESSWPTLDLLCDWLLNMAVEVVPLYREYAQNYPILIDTLDVLQVLPKFNSFLAEALEKCSLSLLQLLPLPLSHVYSMDVYLQELADTSELCTSSRDRDSLLDAWSIIHQSAVEISQGKEELYRLSQLLKLKRRIVGANESIFQGGHILCKEGELKVDKLLSSNQNGYVFLFNDLILVTTAPAGVSGERYSAYSLLNLEGAVFTELTPADTPQTKETLPARGGTSYRNKIPQTPALGFRVTAMTAQGLESFTFYANSVSLHRSWVKEVKINVDNCNKCRVFGVPLIELLDREKPDNGIPFIVQKLVDHLRAVGLQEEGLLRISGPQADITKLKDAFNKGETVDLSSFAIATVSSVLKMFFRELPEPLVPFSSFQSIIHIQERDDLSFDKKIELLTMEMRKLPLPNLRVLRFIIKFLYEVSRYSEKNKMPARNLSIVMTPGLIRPPELTMETSLQLPLLNTFTEILIELHKDLLPVTEIRSRSPGNFLSLQRPNQPQLMSLTQSVSSVQFYRAPSPTSKQSSPQLATSLTSLPHPTSILPPLFKSTSGSNSTPTPLNKSDEGSVLSKSGSSIVFRQQISPNVSPSKQRPSTPPPTPTLTRQSPLTYPETAAPFSYSPVNGEQVPPQILRRLTEAQVLRFENQKQRINDSFVKNKKTLAHLKSLGLKFTKGRRT